jgi:predicted O-methyltransferase YrrM
LWPEFAANLGHAGLLSSINVHRCFSVEAAAAFADQSVDFVFIDATHTLEDVSQDIASWWPKVKAGGLIAGHDYPNFPGVSAPVNAFVAERGLGHAFRLSGSSWMVDKSLSIDAA